MKCYVLLWISLSLGKDGVMREFASRPMIVSYDEVWSNNLWPFETIPKATRAKCQRFAHLWAESSGDLPVDDSLAILKLDVNSFPSLRGRKARSLFDHFEESLDTGCRFAAIHFWYYRDWRPLEMAEYGRSR